MTIDIYPYDFEEFLKANSVSLDENSFHLTQSRARIFGLFDDYFNFGGFPEGAHLWS